jgi:hypothetical protein
LNAGFLFITKKVRKSQTGSNSNYKLSTLFAAEAGLKKTTTTKTEITCALRLMHVRKFTPILLHACVLFK